MMSRASTDIMRRALYFCSQGLLQKTASVPAAAFSTHFSVHMFQQLPTRSTLYSNSRRFSDVRTFSKESESDKQPLPALTNINSKSPFMDELALCTSPSDVLNLSCRIAPTSPQLSHCLSHIWNSTKRMSEEQRRLELKLMWEHAGWQRLLQRLVGSVSYLPDSDLVYALLALVKLGVGPKTRAVQTYLRAAQERINDFDDKNLSILSSCLGNMEEGVNVKALKHGIRLLVEQRLPRINNLVHLQTMMRLMGKDAPLKLKRKLESKALSLSDQFTLPNTRHMFSVMAALGFTSKPLLSVCSRKITEHLSEIQFNHLLTVLVSCSELKFRDLQLLEAVSEYSTSMVQVWSNKQLIMLLSSLESLYFRPAALLDSFSDRVLSDPEALPLRDLLCLLRVCSSLNYHNHSLVSCLTSALDQYLQSMTPLQLLRALHSLAVMGHFPRTLLNSLLQESTMNQLRERESKSVQAQLKVMELCLRLDRPELPDTLFVPPSVPCVPQPAASVCPKPEFSSALQTLMKHRQEWSVKEAELLENRYFIDAVLTKSENNSEKGQRRAVLCVGPSAFCFGTSHPKGPLAMKLRHLKVLGYLALLVPEQEFVSLSEERRVEFLREHIFTND